MVNMYSKLPNLVLGFHGCDIETYKKVIIDREPLQKSMNNYDWLGNGIYFWEQNYERASEWAKSRAANPKSKIQTPAVIGAIIDLGYCLNLTDYASTAILKRGYEMLSVRCEILGKPLPENHSIGNSGEILIRDLDCAVIEQIHYYNKSQKLPCYDSVRGIFNEGNRVYPGSEFYEKTHVQLCIVNPNCIKGYFSPMSPDKGYMIP